MTSFLVDDLFSDEEFFGAQSVLVTSASSKTSIALGHLLHQRSGARAIGLTSARNEAFVASLGCYDEVVRYDALDRIDGTGGAILVDMAGNGQVVATIHERLRDQLSYSCTVGGTHWESAARPTELPGPTPEFFFAPARITKRTADWGGAGLQERIGSAWRDFLTFSDSWLEVKRHRGADALERVYLDALEGRLEPREGHVLSLW